MLRGVQNGGKKGMRDDGKALERENDIQRSEVGVIWKSSNTTPGKWIWNVVSKCTGEEKSKSIWGDVFEKHMWHQHSGQSKKLANMREVRVWVDCTEKELWGTSWNGSGMCKEWLRECIMQMWMATGEERERPQRRWRDDVKELMIRREWEKGNGAV